jgi:hypothetical protein
MTQKYSFDARLHLAKVSKEFDSNLNGTCFSGWYVKCSYYDLETVFGEETRDESGDGKVKREWVFTNGDKSMVVTIYDWKEEKDPKEEPLEDIIWHVGSRGISMENVKSFLKTTFADAGAGYIQVTADPWTDAPIESCKGCGGELNEDEALNALSRYDHGYICSKCGEREAFEGNFIAKVHN